MSQRTIYLAIAGALIAALIGIALVLTTSKPTAEPPPPGKTQAFGPKQAKKAVIVIHGGGYLIGSTKETEDSARAFARAGYRAINLEYPRGDLLATNLILEQAIKKAKRNYKYVYVYGESAGGGLAALATARSLADGGYAWAPVSDLIRWKAYSAQEELIDWSKFRDSSLPTLEKLSAITYASDKSAPLLLVHGRQDETVPYDYSLSLQDKYPQMTLLSVQGGHDSDEASHRNSTRLALSCFAGNYPCEWAKENR